MTQPTLRFIVDVALLAAFTAMLAFAAVVRIVFPAGPDADGWSLWGLGYDQWHWLQFAALVVFVLMVLLHLILQWNWICNYITSRLRRRTQSAHRPLPDGIKTLYGVALLITVMTLLGTLLAWGSLAVRPPGDQPADKSVIDSQAPKR